MMLQRIIRRHGTTILICGIILTFLIITMINICTPASEIEREVIKRGKTGGSTINKSEALALTVHYDRVTFLMVIVMSVPKNFKSRMVIRETWAWSKSTLSSVCFVLGTKGVSNQTLQELQDEQWLHQDLILLEDFQESYTALTEKLLKTFVWINKHVDFKYLLKVDEDSFVQLNALLQELESKPTERLYWGFFNGKARVYKTGKWIEKDFILCDHYLPYALGGGYVISCDLVEHIAKNHKLLKLFFSEDVSLGVWLAPLDIQRQHDPRFDTEYKSRGCFNSYLVTHKKSQGEMKALQDSIDSTNKLCVEEFRSRPSYQYNWNVLPSNCCNKTNDVP